MRLTCVYLCLCAPVHVCMSLCVYFFLFISSPSMYLPIALLFAFNHSLSLAISVHIAHYSFVSFRFLLQFCSSLGKMFQFLVVVVIVARARSLLTAIHINTNKICFIKICEAIYKIHIYLNMNRPLIRFSFFLLWYWYW